MVFLANIQTLQTAMNASQKGGILICGKLVSLGCSFLSGYKHSLLKTCRVINVINDLKISPKLFCKPTCWNGGPAIKITCENAPSSLAIYIRVSVLTSLEGCHGSFGIASHISTDIAFNFVRIDLVAACYNEVEKSQ